MIKLTRNRQVLWNDYDHGKQENKKELSVGMKRRSSLNRIEEDTVVLSSENSIDNEVDDTNK